MSLESSGGASFITPQSCWALIRNEEVIDVTFSPFSINEVDYGPETLLRSEEELFDLGLYKLITPTLEVGDFQHAVIQPSSTWTVDEENKTITKTFEIKTHAWIDIKVMLEYSITKSLDNLAQQRQYDNIISAISYVNSTVESYRNEAIHCMTIRDSTWEIWSTIIQDVENQTRPIPISYDEVFSLLPSIAW